MDLELISSLDLSVVRRVYYVKQICLDVRSFLINSSLFGIISLQGTFQELSTE